jgi:hypothetical protein
MMNKSWDEPHAKRSSNIGKDKQWDWQNRGNHRVDDEKRSATLLQIFPMRNSVF